MGADVGDEHRLGIGPSSRPLARRRLFLGLRGKGLTRTDDAPDLLVAYFTSVKESLKVTNWGSGHGRRRWHRNDLRIDVRHEGTLILDILDAPKRELVWRGRATGLVDRSDNAKERVNEAVKALLAEFPPSP